MFEIVLSETVCSLFLKFSISLERNPISLEVFNLDLLNSPQKIEVGWVTCLKMSISLEI